MVRSQIVVEKIPEIHEAYHKILEIDSMEVIKLENYIKDDMPRILLNVIYDHSIIGEIIIRCGEKPANYYVLRFLDNLANSYSVMEFQEHLWDYCDRLQEKNLFYKKEVPKDPEELDVVGQMPPKTVQ